MRTTLIRSTVVALALSASVAPVAVAQDGGGSFVPPRLQTADDRNGGNAGGRLNAPLAPTSVKGDGGLDWGDAGIGGGVIGALALVAGGGALVARRRSTAAV
jgi:hypothetical protein